MEISPSDLPIHLKRQCLRISDHHNRFQLYIYFSSHLLDETTHSVLLVHHHLHHQLYLNLLQFVVKDNLFIVVDFEQVINLIEILYQNYSLLELSADFIYVGFIIRIIRQTISLFSIIHLGTLSNVQFVVVLLNQPQTVQMTNLIHIHPILHQFLL